MALFDDLDQGLIYQDGWTRVLGGVDSIEGIEEVLLLPFVTRLDLMRLAVTRGMINIFRDLILYCTELDSDAVIGLIDHACLSVRYEFLDIIAQAVTHIEPHNGDHMLGLLISFGFVDVSDGSTPLTFAVSKGVFSFVDFLLSRGLDVNERDRMGMSPLRAALCYNRPQLANRLIEMYDANVTEQTVEDLEPLIYEVLEHPSKIELIKLFVLRGCDLSQPDSNGNYPIHYLARCNAEGTRELFPLLAKTGTNFANSANKHGATPLQFAVWNDNLELIKLLEKYGSIKLKKDFKMVWHWSIMYDATQVFKYMIRRGYNPREAVYENITLGERAYLHPNPSFLHYTLMKKASPYHLRTFRVADLELENPLTDHVLLYLIEGSRMCIFTHEISLEGATDQIVDKYKCLIERTDGFMWDVHKLAKICDKPHENWMGTHARDTWLDISNKYKQEDLSIITVEFDEMKRWRRARMELEEVGRHLSPETRNLITHYRSCTVSDREKEIEWVRESGSTIRHNPSNALERSSQKGQIQLLQLIPMTPHNLDPRSDQTNANI
ncbi:hypothetical protein QAD02_021501 [Eretmocerus hayati]|uniref:Uncharacterized protein n=1 Tax=Eretmocerus hayati TaxID=131215 RepID=A0ACC2PRT5_9HYME|nr:hypothetical protein QAD02_021501 [Eretmocerus hayati]